MIRTILTVTLLLGITESLTLKEARRLGDPSLIQYDTSASSRQFHAIVSYILVYSILICIITAIALVNHQLIRFGLVEPTKRGSKL